MTDTEKSLIAAVDVLQTALKHYANPRCWDGNTWVGDTLSNIEDGPYLAQRALRIVARTVEGTKQE